MAQRKQYLRHDYNPSLATGTGFQVAEGIVRLIVHGLSVGESVGIEMRLYANGDERWTPYAPCNGQLALTSANTIIRIADTGEYRLTPTATSQPVVVLLQEDETTSDAKIVYNVPVSACLPAVSSGSGGPTHPPVSVTVGLTPTTFNAATQALQLSIPPKVLFQPNAPIGGSTFIVYDPNDGSASTQYEVADIYRQQSPTSVSVIGQTALLSFLVRAFTLLEPTPVEVIVNGVAYSDPNDVTVTITPNTALFGQLGYVSVIVAWNNNLFVLEPNDDIKIQYNDSRI